MGTLKPSYTRQTLDETPERALQFLAGVGTVPSIRASLASRGYSDADHAQGWKLLHAATGFESTVPPPQDDRSVAQAIAEIDEWDEPNFRLARATLARHFPTQAEFVFNELSPATGTQALLSVSTFLNRLDMLEGVKKGRDHSNKSVKKEDEEAIALLAKRGIHAAERARLRKLLSIAESGQKPDDPRVRADTAEQETRRQDHLAELRGWFDEWTEVARVVITRRDYLIRLGLARRRVGKKDEDGADPDPKPGPGETDK